jgi:hypothetical protein
MSADIAGVRRGASVAEAMTPKGTSCIVVLDSDQAVGVLMERDLLRRIVAPEGECNLHLIFSRLRALHRWLSNSWSFVPWPPHNFFNFFLAKSQTTVVELV